LPASRFGIRLREPPSNRFHSRRRTPIPIRGDRRGAPSALAARRAGRRRRSLRSWRRSGDRSLSPPSATVTRKPSRWPAVEHRRRLRHQPRPARRRRRGGLTFPAAGEMPRSRPARAGDARTAHAPSRVAAARGSVDVNTADAAAFSTVPNRRAVGSRIVELRERRRGVLRRSRAFGRRRNDAEPPRASSPLPRANLNTIIDLSDRERAFAWENIK